MIFCRLFPAKSVFCYPGVEHGPDDALLPAPERILLPLPNNFRLLPHGLHQSGDAQRRQHRQARLPHLDLRPAVRQRGDLPLRPRHHCRHPRGLSLQRRPGGGRQERAQDCPARLQEALPPEGVVGSTVVVVSGSAVKAATVAASAAAAPMA